jgi:hypothetical protein
MELCGCIVIHTHYADAPEITVDIKFLIIQNFQSIALSIDQISVKFLYSKQQERNRVLMRMLTYGRNMYGHCGNKWAG